jgi:RHS repeat-associated protein
MIVTHDLDDRLRKVEEYANGLPSSAWTFDYDAFGRLIEASNGTTEKRFWYAGWNRIAETDGQAQAVSASLVGPALDTVYAVHNGSGTRYLHTDLTGSVRAVTDESGEVTGRREYGLYGRVVGGGGTWNIPYGFASRPDDCDCGITNFRNRWYDPTLGRFLETDPFPRLWESSNRYLFADGQPLRFADPLGLSPLDPEVRRLQNDAKFLTDIGNALESAGNALNYLGGGIAGLGNGAKDFAIHGKDDVLWLMATVDASILGAYGLTGLPGSEWAYNVNKDWVEYEIEPALKPLRQWSEQLVDAGIRGDSLEFLGNSASSTYANAQNGFADWWNEYDRLYTSGDYYAAGEHLTHPIGYVGGAAASVEILGAAKMPSKVPYVETVTSTAPAASVAPPASTVISAPTKSVPYKIPSNAPYIDVMGENGGIVGIVHENDLWLGDMYTLYKSPTNYGTHGYILESQLYSKAPGSRLFDLWPMNP